MFAKYLSVLLLVIGVIVGSKCFATPGSIWIHPDSLATRDTTLLRWKDSSNGVWGVAKQALPSAPYIGHCDSKHELHVLACALVAVRKSDSGFRTKATNGILEAINSFSTTACNCDSRNVWLCIGRNLGGYVIAADLLGLRGGLPGSDSAQIQAFFSSFLTRSDIPGVPGQGTPTGITSYNNGGNAYAQVAFVHATIAAYLGDTLELGNVRTRFRKFAGDRTSPHIVTSTMNGFNWQTIQTNRFGPDNVGIQDANGIRQCCRLDGAVADDIERANNSFTCTLNPGSDSQYPWVGLSGTFGCAIILERNGGFSAGTIATNSLLRAIDFMYNGWLNIGAPSTNDGLWKQDRGDHSEIIHLTNIRYNTSYPRNDNVFHRTALYEFTEWTHPTNW